MQQVLSLLSNLDITTLIMAFIILFSIFYALVSLFTWNLLKPLKYLGIPTLVVGILTLFIRFASSSIINILTNEFGDIVKQIFPFVLTPLQNIGIIFFVLGLLMLIIYAIINNKKKNNVEIENEEIIKEEF